MKGFRELIVGDVLIAPFVSYAFCAALIIVLLRPVFSFLDANRAFLNPPLVLFAVYVIVLATLITI